MQLPKLTSTSKLVWIKYLVDLNADYECTAKTLKK